MSKQQKTAVSPTRNEDYPQWYQQVIKVSDLAENSEVRGCMVIKPWGYAIWENIQHILDGMFKATGHKNAYFPLFIPKSFFEKEAKHIEGFAKECAVVTHSRLEDDGQGGLKVAGELTEPLIVRPTSETIIGASFSKWITSYRDLPLLINQWANVVRWEMRTRLFLRTTEFLWQEGHTAHATPREAAEETSKMLEVYRDFAENHLAMPVICGEKTDGERFPGAVHTYSIEAMMQDRKALQAGTSHFLGQNFARSSNIVFTNSEGQPEHAWTTSWGVSTRLIGAIIMAHSDDNGLVLPPRIAPAHVAIIPIYPGEEHRRRVDAFVDDLAGKLAGVNYMGRPVIVETDRRDLTGSERAWHWIKKGIPVRIEIGPRDVDNGSVFMGRRDLEPRQKESHTVDSFVERLPQILDDIQNKLFKRALSFREAHTRAIESREEFYAHFTPKNEDKPEIHGGFAMCHWCGDRECEDKIREDLKVTIRCIPLDAELETGTCVVCGRQSGRRVVFAKCY